MQTNEIRFLSINTDASFHKETGCGGWAFVTLGDGIRIIKKGKFKKCPDNAFDAEVKCMINAITDLLNKEIPSIKHIIINTDCESIVKGIKKKCKNPSLILLKQAVNKLKEKTNCNNLHIQHVRAHTSNKGKYSIINKYVDKFAREMMRKQLKTL